MKKQHSQQGFTLVELAIVMTIIGLLIGGILKGQELMENARVTSTIAQIRAYEAAVTTFQDAYNATPGDMANAATRLRNCAGCNATPVSGNLGDQLLDGTGSLGADNSALTSESTRFWIHLLRAELVTGVTDAAITAGTQTWGEAYPAAQIGGGFHAGTGTAGTAIPNGGNAAATQTNGLSLILRQAPTGNLPGNTTGLNPMSALRAAQIDRRIDDGNPLQGYVRGFGPVSDATTSPPTLGCIDYTNAVYSEGTEGDNCGLAFRLQG